MPTTRSLVHKPEKNTNFRRWQLHIFTAIPIKNLQKVAVHQIPQNSLGQFGVSIALLCIMNHTYYSSKCLPFLYSMYGFVTYVCIFIFVDLF